MCPSRVEGAGTTTNEHCFQMIINLFQIENEFSFVDMDYRVSLWH